MTQKARILAHLKRGRPLTAMQALHYFGCARLAARIEELRDKGWQISTEMIGQGSKRYAKYRLIKQQRGSQC